MKESGGRSTAPDELAPERLLHIVSGARCSFPIVGIRASAGVPEALRRLLGSLPNDTGMAYVLVQSLDPRHDSIVAELLAQSTELVVSEVKGDVRVAPDHTCAIPPSKDLILVDGTLRLVPRSSVGSVPMPIDSFLRPLADVQGSQAIGVILFGMGSDGTLGLQAIEAVGGLTFAQEPASAKNDDMPRSAVRAGGVDGQGLAQTTEYMHRLVREHESALEELQSTTEEALSGNEELQSLNEELQTAKEEIELASEELVTLNQELQDRNEELARFNDAIQRGLDNANALVNAVPQPLVILDGELRIVKANFAFHRKFGMTAETIRDRFLSELSGDLWSKPALLTALKDVLATGTTVEELEVEAELPSIGLGSMSLNAQRLHLERGSRGRILLAIEDRTEVKRSQREREAVLGREYDARTRAETADHLKDQFVATVSHELRGPLNVISGWVNILLAAGDSPDNAVLTKALSAIARGVAAQTRLISDLIDHSRIVTGKVELQRVAINLVTVAEAALVGVRAAADAKDIDLVLSGDRATSVILGDFDRMQQVLWNLFFNAVKFTPPGGSVEIAIGRVGNQVHVTVSDDGRGIPQDFLPYVFDRFRQAEGSSSRAQPGLGLGLTLVRELVELHGGTVGATSAGTGQGATFTVILPIPRHSWGIVGPPPVE